jgi:acetyl esterase/lipase
MALACGLPHAVSSTTRASAPAYDPDLFTTARFASVQTTSNIPYATVMATTYNASTGTYNPRTTTTLTLDLYEPAGDPATTRPVIIWIHGGGFRVDSYKTQGYIVTYATEFAKRGFSCVSIEYRRCYSTNDGHGTEFPALQDAARDANKALDWVRANAAAHKFDTNYVFMAGGSAGGRTAITVSEFDGPDADAAYPPETDYKTVPWNKAGIVACAVLWGGLEPDMRGWVYPYLQPTDVPAVFVHGDADTTIDVQNSIDLHNALTAAGATSELHILPGAGHTPTTSANNPQIWAWIGSFFISEWKKDLAGQGSATVGDWMLYCE